MIDLQHNPETRHFCRRLSGAVRCAVPACGRFFRRVGTGSVVAGAAVLLAVGGCQTTPDSPEEVVVTQGEPAEHPSADEHHHGPDHPGAEGIDPPADQPVTPQTGEETPGGEGLVVEDQPPAAGGDGESAHPTPRRSVERAEEHIDAHPSSPGGADAAGEEDHVADDIPTAPADVSDTQAENFAAAYIEVMDLQYEYEHRLEATSDPDEITALHQQLDNDTRDAVASHDLSIEEFNAIADMLERDTELRDQIQSEIDSLAQ